MVTQLPIFVPLVPLRRILCVVRAEFPSLTVTKWKWPRLVGISPGYLSFGHELNSIHAHAHVHAQTPRAYLVRNFGLEPWSLGS